MSRVQIRPQPPARALDTAYMTPEQLRAFLWLHALARADVDRHAINLAARLLEVDWEGRARA